MLFEIRLQRLNVNDDEHVVLYDTESGRLMNADGSLFKYETPKRLVAKVPQRIRFRIEHREE
jgi:hypothetical protein